MEKIILGQMTGTSLDGIDLALTQIKTTPENSLFIKLLDFKTYEYPENVRRNIQNAFDTNTAEICSINYEFSRWCAAIINGFLASTKIKEVDAIGFHGQTIYHIDKNSTFQIGDGDVLSYLTNIPVIHDFRAADIAAGGTGAPLIPYLDKTLLGKTKKNVALQNLGGIGNVTFLPRIETEQIIAFDTGPANSILNELVEINTDANDSFDTDGKYSSQGHIDEGLLDFLLQHEYFNIHPPKSTGRELFGREYVENITIKFSNLEWKTVLRTFVKFVAETIKLSYEVYLPEIDEIYLSGGGIHNPNLLADLRSIFGNKLHLLSEILEFSEDSKEAVGFALLAFERLRGVQANLPEVTGAKEKVLLGKIADPKGKWTLNSMI